MTRIPMTRGLAASALAVALALAGPAAAFMEPTHDQMSRRAARASVLEQRLPSFGSHLKLFTLESRLGNGGFNLFGSTVFEDTRLVMDWIGHGAVLEDGGIRFFRHFFNPLTRQGLGSFASSLEWGLEAQPISGQEFSYRDLRDYYEQGQVAATERERKRNMANFLLGLGHVMHLVQDAAQPQHTRPEGHPFSRFERYARDNLITFLGYAPVNVTDPQQLWTTPDRKGAADYSNRNFVTEGGNFTGVRVGSLLVIQPVPGYPEPNGLNHEIERRPIGELVPGTPLAGEVWFVKTPAVDALRPDPDPMVRTSTFSLFDEDLTRRGFEATFTLNRFNFDSHLSKLVPRAVGYSAGIINHFFEGLIQVSLPAEGVYGVADPTQSLGFAKIKLRVRNPGGAGSDLAGSVRLVAKFHRNHCYETDLTGEFGGPNAPDIFACRGEAEEMVITEPQALALAGGAQPRTLTFELGDSPLPINAMDLFMQLVFTGSVGSRPDATVVATVDLAEPTHIAFFNGTDLTEINDTFYRFDQVLAGIAAGDPTFAIIDLNQDKQYGGGDQIVTPFDFNNANVSFTGPNANVVARIPSLPQGRFARIVALTDQPAVLFFPANFGFQLPSAFNQLSDDRTTFFVTPAFQFRNGVWVTDAAIVTFCPFGTSCNGSLENLPPTLAPNATTPLPVTITFQ